MARSVSHAKLISAFVIEKISSVASRRGYAAASQGAVSRNVSVGNARNSMMLKKGGEETTKTTSWIPDPVTGYYRPENHAKEIDAAELRMMLLKNKN
ncbi:hypothetical protein M9H77_01685 [Catharanthus roseus]|uniref:Uncharacterized protein n=1 Tax=Catharanthus roseus TaxID=4058 RepID=A0ACC0C6R5_CATRO|nr:hypothetical protein M9H77_01685 [Catharanthus roseus]